MTAYSSSFKLHLLARPTAFDVDVGRELVYIATNEGIQLIRLPHLSAGAPSRTIHYDQPQVVKKVASHAAYLSVLRGGVLSIWDVQQSLTPLKSLIHTPNSFIVDFDISPIDEFLLATCFDSGEVSVYDIRSGSTAYRTNQPSHRNLTRIQQCNDYIAITGSSTLTVMDTRVLSCDGYDRCVLDLDLGAPIQQSTWCNASTIATGYGGSVSFWNIDSASQLSVEYPFPGSHLYKFLPTPSGNTLIVASERKSSTEKTAQVKLSALRVPEPMTEPEGEHRADLAVLRDPLIDMALGSPGQLVPPFEFGLELLLLSQSAVLHALKVVDGPFTRSRTTSVRSSPVFPARELRREMRRANNGGDFFAECLRSQVLELEELIETGDQRGLSIISVDPYAKQGVIT